MMKFLHNYRILVLLLIAGVLFNGCSDDDDEDFPKPISRFTLDIDELTGEVTFLNISENAEEYRWDFGDETSSKEKNPVKSYANGTFTVSLTAFNVVGDSSVSTDEITIFVQEIISLPATFDDTINVRYEATTFGGASFDIVSNPDQSGTNEKEGNVARITNIGAEFEGIYFDLQNDISLENDKSITMNFWSEVAVDVLLKLEEGDGADTETTASHTGNGWEELIFDFTSGDSFSRITIFVDASGTTAGTFYLDDIRQSATIDITPPVITLLGDAAVNAVLGSTYTDAGATALDNFDGDITSQIVVTGLDAVDTSIEDAVYTISYDVTDAAGNAAATVTRTVTIVTVDTEAPVITLEGDNPFNLDLGTAFVDPGATALDNVDGTIPFSSFTVTGTIDINTAGTYTLTYNVSDAAGNAATPVARDVVVTPAELLINGDFQDPSQDGVWTGNAANIVEASGNRFNEANVAPPAGDAFNVNLSQAVALNVGSIYRFSFDASTGAGTTRTMIVGIGQSVGPFLSNTEEVTLTETTQTFTFDLPTIDDGTGDPFGEANNRVLFDMGADVGVVVIDNVSLTLISDGGSGGGGGGGGSSGSNLITNGNFETGDVSGWVIETDSDPNKTFTAASSPAQDNFSGNMKNAVQTSNFVIAQSGLQAGAVPSNTDVVISFDVFESAVEVGGVLFAELFFIASDDSASNIGETILGGTPLPLDNGAWKTFTFTVNSGTFDAVGGLKLLFAAQTGAGSLVDVYIDNVSVTISE